MRIIAPSRGNTIVAALAVIAVACSEQANPSRRLSPIDAQLEKEKRSAQILADHILNSLSYPCRGNYFYYYSEMEDFSDLTKYELNNARIKKHVKFVKAKDPTEVEFLNNIVYRNKLYVYYTISNKKSSKIPVIVRKRSVGEEWSAWAEHRALKPYGFTAKDYKLQTEIFGLDEAFHGYYPFLQVSFSKNATGPYELEGIVTRPPTMSVVPTGLGRIIRGVEASKAPQQDQNRIAWMNKYIRGDAIKSPGCENTMKDQYHNQLFIQGLLKLNLPSSVIPPEPSLERNRKPPILTDGLIVNTTDRAQNGPN